MNEASQKRDIAVSMRFREDDLDLIDKGATLNGLSRTEFMRRAALNEAQIAVINETLVRVSPDAYEHFCQAIEGFGGEAPAKLKDRLGRKLPWDESAEHTASS
jgi:uncharacterized protein (DUF1778 family)